MKVRGWYLLGRREIQGDGVDTVTLVRRGREAFSFKDVTQVTTAIFANDLDALHPERDVLVTLHSPRDLIVKSRPPTPRVEFELRFVQRSTTTLAVVRPRVIVLVKCASVCDMRSKMRWREVVWFRVSIDLPPFYHEFFLLTWPLGPLLTEDVELLGAQQFLPVGFCGIRNTERRSVSGGASHRGGCIPLKLNQLQ